MRSRDSRLGLLALVSWLCLTGAASAAGPDLRLLEAAKSRDGQTLRALLKEGVDVNTARADGATPLFWAVHWDDAEAVDLLLKARANVNATDDHGVTPLILACENGNAAVVDKLLAAGAERRMPRSTADAPHDRVTERPGGDCPDAAGEGRRCQRGDGRDRSDRADVGDGRAAPRRDARAHRRRRQRPRPVEDRLHAAALCRQERRHRGREDAGRRRRERERGGLRRHPRAPARRHQREGRVRALPARSESGRRRPDGRRDGAPRGGRSGGHVAARLVPRAGHRLLAALEPASTRRAASRSSSRSSRTAPISTPGSRHRPACRAG